MSLIYRVVNFFISTALAQDHGTPPLGGGAAGTQAVSSISPQAMVAGIYQFALLIGGLLAFGAIIYSAIKYALSAGNPTGQGDARSGITDALLGLLLLMAAYLILNTINPNLTKLYLPPLQQLDIFVPENTVNIGRCSPNPCGTNSICVLDSSEAGYKCVTSFNPQPGQTQCGCKPEETCVLTSDTNGLQSRTCLPKICDPNITTCIINIHS